MSTPEPMAVRELILASAGSGKTFRISSRLIGLLARGEPASSIFASTFTRKAAGEILDRVLQRLANAATDEDEARALATHALEPGGPGDDPSPRGFLGEDVMADPTSPSFWQEVLHRTVRSLHRLDVGTLDSFFVRAVRGFGHELGLPSGWGIADDPVVERLQSEALEEVLRRTDEGALVELMRALHAGDARRSVHQTLFQEVDGILRVHLDLDPEGPGWGAMDALTQGAPETHAQQAHARAEALRQAPVPAKANGDPDRRWEKPRDAAAELLDEGDWDGFLDNGLVGKLLDAVPGEEPTYYGSGFPEALREAFSAALSMVRRAIAGQLAARAAAMGRLAEDYEKAYLERLLQSGLLRFEDVTRLLTQSLPGSEGRAAAARRDLFYRLDSGTRHILLDEFQDTSLLQWRALSPLMDRLAGTPDQVGPGAAVVVADPKQSIYGWRGAAPLVVDALAERYELPRTDMAVSWRSSQVVLDAVNQVFGTIHEAPVLQEKPADAAVAADWASAFRPHVAADRDPALPGRVRLLCGAPLDGSGKDQPEFYRWVADHIRAVHDGAPGMEIGVLTRTNAAVAQIIFELTRRDTPASEEGGTRITDSAAVVSVLALLRMVDHPGDRLARYHVARTPVGPAVGYVDETDDAGALGVTHRLRERLVARGYGPVLGDLAHRLRHACTTRDEERLRRLVEVGYQWDSALSGPGLRVGDFVRLAESRRAESPGEDPVRVMTIHGSKGLEFDIVVVPELFGRSFSRRSDSSPLAFRPAGIGPITHAFPPIRKAYLSLFDDVDEIREADAQARAASTRDALGALYVAMTRARYALDLIIPSDGENGPGRTRSHARLLREQLAPERADETAGPGEVLYDHGNPGWTDGVAARPRSGTTPTRVPDIRLRRDAPRVRNLERKTPSGAEGGGRVQLDYLLGLVGGVEARQRGTLVHAWLESLEWMETGLAPEEELRAIARRSVPDLEPPRIDVLLDWLRHRLQADPIRAQLSRESWPRDATVERELPFLLRQGDALVEGIVDRLVLEHEGDRVVRATVLDFKTDAVDESEALEDRVRYYAPQIRAYREAVATLYRLDPAEVGGLLLFLDPGLVREVGP